VPENGPATHGYGGRVPTTVSMWGEHGPRPALNHELDELFRLMTAVGSVDVDCSPQQAWALISDIERIGEFSPECVEAWWVEGFPPAGVGGRFEGRNRLVQGDDVLEWIRPCDVLEWDPPTSFSYTVGDRYDGSPATRWTFTVEPREGGARLRLAFAHLPDGLSGIRGAAESQPLDAPAIVKSRVAQLHGGIHQTLAAMKSVLEGEATRH